MFTPLHVKSDYSLGYGTAAVDELVAGAAALGYRTLALTAASERTRWPCGRRHSATPVDRSLRRSRPAGTKLCLVVIVAAMRRVPTRQGPMQFLTVEDETGLLEAAVLPPAYRRLGERISTPGPFLIEGRLRRQQDAAHLDVSDITPFHEREQPYGLKV